MHLMRKNLKIRHICDAIMDKTFDLGGRDMKHLGEVGQICCARYKAGDMDVQATLLMRACGVGHCYQIMLEQEGECARCDLGDALEPAKKLFFVIVFVFYY